MRFCVLTLGCKVNQSETDSIESSLVTSGHEMVPMSESPDICIINTCTVTSNSDCQSRRHIRRAVRSGAKVYVTGCYAQLNGKEIHDISPSIEIVDNFYKIQYINELFNISKTKTLNNGKSRSRAFIKIQDGCDRRCTYCTVPRARGGSRSYAKERIIREIERAYVSGFNETVLSGVHIGLYGCDFERVSNIKDLLADILNKTGIPRIRLSSLEINELDDELLDIMEDKRVCKHLHIPLQSGDDMVLKKMGRSYNASKYSRALDSIFTRFPDISIGTDIIVGFPGEDERAFNNTSFLLNNAGFSYIHVFPYSKRKGTPAWSYPDHIDSKTKQARVNVLRELSQRKKLGYMKKFIGKTLDTIVETEMIDGTYTSTSGNYLKIRLAGTNLEKGSLINTKVAGITNNKYLIGIPM